MKQWQVELFLSGPLLTKESIKRLVLIRFPGKHTADRHPWHAETCWEPLLLENGWLLWFSWHPGLLTHFTFFMAKRKKKVDGLVLFYQGTICIWVHEGCAPPCACWHHTELCPLQWLLSEPRRQSQTSRWLVVNLDFLLVCYVCNTGFFFFTLQRNCECVWKWTLIKWILKTMIFL